MKTILVTGSSGLIGSEVCSHFHERDFAVHGVDNNMRSVFFGQQGDTRSNQKRLTETLANFTHHELDVRDRDGIRRVVAELKPDVILHAAGQPSHDLAASIPFDDFDTNAVGTLNLLEAVRQTCPESPFIFMSTNKVYGDGPNTIALKELDTRWDFDDLDFEHGISESFSIDQRKHSLFGASKVAADVMVQEYGRYFSIPTCCLRASCLSGPWHAGVELHGFLNYLIKRNLADRRYTVFGYKGKQVRDIVHSEDVASFIFQFAESPRIAEVYNIGGGKENSASILELFQIVESITGNRQEYVYDEHNRIGDHICYYSDLRKLTTDYPKWRVTKTLEDTIRDTVEKYQQAR